MLRTLSAVNRHERVQRCLRPTSNGMKRRESEQERRTRTLRGRVVLRKLKQLFPDASMMLTYKNDWELLVAVQLSAQCTDKKVNEVTPRLFARHQKLNDYVNADPREFERLIYQTGFYRNKTKNILAAAKMVKQKFHGKIPETMGEMLQIPGVARKTANVVLGNAHGVVEGVAVDTHVKRLAHVLGLSDEHDPNKIEQDLMEIFPKRDWFRATYLLIEYGRNYCPARKHDQTKCPLGHHEINS